MEIKLPGSAVHRESSSTQLILFLLVVLLLVPQLCFSQQDSIKQGVVKVRRAPVPSTYMVSLSYSYSPAKQNFFQHLLRRKKAMLPENTEEIFPPQPVSFPAQPDDSARALQDSSYLIQFFEKEDRPAGEYPWVNWLDQYEHYFQWSDTSGIDSCTFVYSVNTRGRVEINAIAGNRDDSSAAALQNALWPYMRKLWLWYPAVWVAGDTGKQKKVNCTVTVKIYAVRDDQQNKLPLKIVD